MCFLNVTLFNSGNQQIEIFFNVSFFLVLFCFAFKKQNSAAVTTQNLFMSFWQTIVFLFLFLFLLPKHFAFHREMLNSNWKLEMILFQQKTEKVATPTGGRLKHHGLP